MMSLVSRGGLEGPYERRTKIPALDICVTSVRTTPNHAFNL